MGIKSTSADADRGRRIADLRKKKGLTQSELADLAGVTPSYVTQIEGGKNFTLDTLKGLSDALNITVDYIINGTDLGLSTSVVHEPSAHYVVETVDNQGEPNIVMVDTQAVAGYTAEGNILEFIKELPTISIPTTILRNGTFRAFRIRGNSMWPKICDGDISIGSFVERAHWTSIADNRVYIVVLESDIVCKRVVNRLREGERGRLRLKSDNAQYNDYEVDKEQVKEVWEWKCNINFDATNPFFDIYNWIQKLENKIYDLELDQKKSRL